MSIVWWTSTLALITNRWARLPRLPLVYIETHTRDRPENSNEGRPVTLADAEFASRRRERQFCILKHAFIYTWMSVRHTRALRCASVTYRVHVCFDCIWVIVFWRNRTPGTISGTNSSIPNKVYYQMVPFEDNGCRVVRLFQAANKDNNISLVIEMAWGQIQWNPFSPIDHRNWKTWFVYTAVREMNFMQFLWLHRVHVSKCGLLVIRDDPGCHVDILFLIELHGTIATNHYHRHHQWIFIIFRQWGQQNFHGVSATRTDKARSLRFTFRLVC